jgi:hypothetical protein
MYPDISLSFFVTPSVQESIQMRMRENGFDNISSYIKVVALNTVPFNISPPALPSTQGATTELSIKVTSAQKERIEHNMYLCAVEEMSDFLLYVALHGVINTVIEVRSTGSLSSMLERIAAKKKANK